MKPFNLEAAKAGKPVCTRDGRPVRILCYDRKAPLYSIVALVKDDRGGDEKETVMLYRKNGYSCGPDIPSATDLMMISEKKCGWVNIYADNEKDKYGSLIYPTENEAINAYEEIQAAGATRKYVATAYIEWEE